MGTRADFYIRRGNKPLEQSDWIGSIAFDGYPEGIPRSVLKAKSARLFRKAFEEQSGDDITLPKDGWPWPWETSDTTDYAYVFSNGRVTWRKTKYPDMTSIRSVTLGRRSGMIVISAGG